MSQYVWEDLSDQEKQWITEASAYARDEQMRLYEEELSTYTAQIKDLGIEYVTLDKTPFVEKTKSILEAEMANSDRADLIKAIQAIK